VYSQICDTDKKDVLKVWAACFPHLLTLSKKKIWIRWYCLFWKCKYSIPLAPIKLLLVKINYKKTTTVRWTLSKHLALRQKSNQRFIRSLQIVCNWWLPWKAQQIYGLNWFRNPDKKHIFPVTSKPDICKLRYSCCDCAVCNQEYVGQTAKFISKSCSAHRMYFKQTRQTRGMIVTVMAIYSKPRLIRIRFDRRFYPVQAKIRINRRWLFLAWSHFGIEILVRIV